MIQFSEEDLVGDVALQHELACEEAILDKRTWCSLVTRKAYRAGERESYVETAAQAKERVLSFFRYAFVAFTVTGNHGTLASAVVRVETSNKRRKIARCDLSEYFVYDGPALGEAQVLAESMAWINAAKNMPGPVLLEGKPKES